MSRSELEAEESGRHRVKLARERAGRRGRYLTLCECTRAKSASSALGWHRLHEPSSGFTSPAAAALAASRITAAGQ